MALRRLSGAAVGRRHRPHQLQPTPPSRRPFVQPVHDVGEFPRGRRRSRWPSRTVRSHIRARHPRSPWNRTGVRARRRGTPSPVQPVAGQELVGASGATKLGAVSAGCVPLQGSSLLTLSPSPRKVSFLNIRDPHRPVHRARNSPGRRVRYPSVTGVDGHVIPQGLPSRNSPCSGAAVVRVAGGLRGCQVVAGPGRFRGR